MFDPRWYGPYRVLLRAIAQNDLVHLGDLGNYEIALCRPLPEGAIGNFGERLDDLINDWIRVWRSAGGLEGLNSPW
jgi:hypothetical protein